jgi:hypothetical protein
MSATIFLDGYRKYAIYYPEITIHFSRTALEAKIKPDAMR